MCYLSEMAQLVVGSASVIRMRLTACREVVISTEDSELIGLPANTAVLSIPKSAPARAMLASLEGVSIVGLRCEDCGDVYRYRYVW